MGTGRNYKEKRCAMSFGVALGVCKGCSCSGGMIKYTTESSPLPVPPAKTIDTWCRRWYLHAVSFAQFWFSRIRLRIMKNKTDKCLGTNTDLALGHAISHRS